MPIHIDYDKNRHLSYVQWGNRTKYYFNPQNEHSYQVALERAKQQMKAIYSNGYKSKK